MDSTSTRRILVVDDEPIVCESVKMMLAHDGHMVQTASSAADALAKYEPAAFDLVITDFCMPGIKGDKLAEALKQRAPEVPVILLTAFPPAIQPKAIDLVLTKPFYFDTLRNALKQVCAAKAA
jgi:CheY-like chemotaxis protein